MSNTKEEQTKKPPVQNEIAVWEKYAYTVIMCFTMITYVSFSYLCVQTIVN